MTIAAPSSVFYFLFPEISYQELPWGRYVFAWCLGPALSTWFLFQWIVWKRILPVTIPFGLQVSIPKATALALAILVVVIGIDFLAALAVPADRASDLELFTYLLHSPMANIMVVMAIIVTPVFEEFTFRGALQSVLSRTRIGFWGSSVALSMLWSVIHWYSYTGTLVIFLSGLLLSFLRLKTGSIVPGIAVHAALNLLSTIYVVAST